jgi:hypothetical protein
VTILKTFLIDIHHPDRRIDNCTPFKAKTLKQALKAAELAHPDAYIGTAIRTQGRREYWRGFKWQDDLTHGRSKSTGQFRFQHKGKKRRGMKNYPTPKSGWRKLYPPVTVTWTETYGPEYTKFMGEWVGNLVKPKEQAA